MNNINAFLKVGQSYYIDPLVITISFIVSLAIGIILIIIYMRPRKKPESDYFFKSEYGDGSTDANTKIKDVMEQDAKLNKKLREYKGSAVISNYQFSKRGIDKFADYLLITKKGTFVINVVREEGEILTPLTEKSLNMKIEDDYRLIANPILVNEKRCEIIKSIYNHDYYVNVVVFNNKTKYKKKTIPQNVIVGNFKTIHKLIKKRMRKTTNTMVEDVPALAQYLNEQESKKD